jgi:hypothetical protein
MTEARIPPTVHSTARESTDRISVSYSVFERVNLEA